MSDESRKGPPPPDHGHHADSSPIAHRSSLPASVRAFLAVDLAPDVLARLVAFKQNLAAAIPSVRWVRDENLHATIKFLGNIAATRVEPLRQALSPVIGRLASFTVRVCGLGAYPSPQRPRIVWIGLMTDELPRLAAAVESALEPLGFTREARPFRSHITLGRIHAPQAWAPLADALRRHGSDDFGSCRINEVVAYRSELQRTGAAYTRLWSIGLVESRQGGSNGAGCEE